MIHLTKDALRDMGIHNSYWIAIAASSCCYIEYHSAERGMLSHYAFFRMHVLLPTKKCAGNAWAHKDFPVYSRNDRRLVLAQVMEFCRERYSIDSFEHEPFGSYQPAGTLNRIVELYVQKNKKEENNAE